MAAQLVSKDLLRAQYVGKSLLQVGTPAIVLDLAKIEANCNLMLDAARRLDLGWRPHIKTHKTIELTKLQVGDKGSSPVNIVVSTLLEAENILPLLKEYQERGRQVNVLYSFPIYGSCVDRLAKVSMQLGPGGLSVMVDHADQVKHLTALASKSGNRPHVFLKVDMGHGRAGVVPDTPECQHLVNQLLLSETVGSAVLLGLYAHAGHSYSTRRDWQAMDMLGAEFAALRCVAAAVRARLGNHGQGGNSPARSLVLSVGATPTTTSLQHPDFCPHSSGGGGEEYDDDITEPLSPELTTSAQNGASETTTGAAAAPTSALKDEIASMRADGYALEVHAGVYSTLDLQQLATHSRDASYLNAAAIGISVLAEVASVYPGRGKDGRSEALVNAGCLAVGREPCEDRGSVPGQHYGAWGLVTPWNASRSEPPPGPGFPAEHGGWQLVRVSQEHGILRWAGSDKEPPLNVGQRLRIWPNHACVAGAGHSFYLVVDSRNRGREDEVVDVWPRWNGW